ncbi:MAG TPA: hypothetical protein VFZ12_00740 [Dehalococcoidia bacterium]|nr:hypothetical protein [Dehalococcoidia bacterium]
MKLPFIEFENVDGAPVTAGDFVVQPKLRRWRMGGRRYWVAESLYPVAVQVESPGGTRTYRVTDYTRVIIAAIAGLILLRLLRRLI